MLEPDAAATVDRRSADPAIHLPAARSQLVSQIKFLKMARVAVEPVGQLRVVLLLWRRGRDRVAEQLAQNVGAFQGSVQVGPGAVSRAHAVLGSVAQDGEGLGVG